VSRSDTGRAVGARVLEPSGYGSLAVLGATFIVMMVPRSALHVAAAREVSTILRRARLGALGLKVPGPFFGSALSLVAVAHGLQASLGRDLPGSEGEGLDPPGSS
jgi:hypothetical protein